MKRGNGLTCGAIKRGVLAYEAISLEFKLRTLEKVLDPLRRRGGVGCRELPYKYI